MGRMRDDDLPAFLADLGVPGLFDTHVHFMPDRMQAAVWAHFDELDPPWPAHHYLLGAGKFGLAQLASLNRLPPTGSLLIPAPLRIVRGSGSPTHIMALVPSP